MFRTERACSEDVAPVYVVYKSPSQSVECQNSSSCLAVLTAQEARAAADAAQARAEKAAAAKQTYKEQAVSLARQLGALQRLRAAELTGPYTHAASDRDDAVQVTAWESTWLYVHVSCRELSKGTLEAEGLACVPSA